MAHTTLSVIGTIVQINAKLLTITFWGWVSFNTFPTHPHWWGFAFLSIFTGLAAAALLINVINKMFDLYKWNKTLAAFQAQGNQPKTSSVVSNDRMREEGLRDD